MPKVLRLLPCLCLSSSHCTQLGSVAPERKVVKSSMRRYSQTVCMESFFSMFTLEELSVKDAIKPCSCDLFVHDLLSSWPPNLSPSIAASLELQGRHLCQGGQAKRPVEHLLSFAWWFGDGDFI